MSGPKISSAIRASPRDSPAPAAPWKPVPRSKWCRAWVGLNRCAAPGSNGFSTTISLILSSASFTFACRPGCRSLSRVYVNGHEWLAQQMVQKKLGFSCSSTSAFTQLDDPAQAQRLADRFAAQLVKDPQSLGTTGQSAVARCARRLPGALGRRPGQVRHRLAVLKVARPWPACTARSLEYAVRTFTPKDILSFLGREWDRRFDGEVHTHYEDDRWFGTRIKHRMETKLAEDVRRQVRPDPSRGNGHQQCEGVPGLSHQMAPRRHFIGGLLPR